MAIFNSKLLVYQRVNLPQLHPQVVLLPLPHSNPGLIKFHIVWHHCNSLRPDIATSPKGVIKHIANNEESSSDPTTTLNNKKQYSSFGILGTPVLQVPSVRVLKGE
jgi:hypothetical protein